MKKMLWKSLKVVLLIIVLYVGGILIHATATDFSPEKVIRLTAYNQSSAAPVIAEDTLSVLIWNLGYAGLGADCNFFFPAQGIYRSKGKMVRPEHKSIVEDYVAFAEKAINEADADFYLLQEMDSSSYRSYHINMIEAFSKVLPDHTHTYSVNYNVQRVPTPIMEPWKAYGKTHSGLVTYSKYKATSNVRFQLPGKHPWPNNLFMLDRCLAIQKIPTDNGKSLYLINLHNSAFDRGGVMKKQELEFLREKILAYYEAGDYVLVGGDWNQSPPYFDANRFNVGLEVKRRGSNIPSDLLPSDWQWIFDPTLPTNRSNSEVYEAGKTYRGLIDFFLISPNIQATKVRTLDHSFYASDHQAVRMEFVLQ